MAIIKCKECNHEISTTAISCPKCGATASRSKIWPWFIGIPLALFILMMIYGTTIPEYENQAREARKVCEKIAPYQKDECWRIYDRAIAEGKTRGEK